MMESRRLLVNHLPQIAPGYNTKGVVWWIQNTRGSLAMDILLICSAVIGRLGRHRELRPGNIFAWQFMAKMWSSAGKSLCIFAQWQIKLTSRLRFTPLQVLRMEVFSCPLLLFFHPGSSVNLADESFLPPRLVF